MNYRMPRNRFKKRGISIPRSRVLMAAGALIAVLVLGNAITALVRDRVTVKEGSYILRNGFPLFTDAKEYLRMVKAYPYVAGVRLSTHRLVTGESYWDVASQYNISIDTLIAANPFITTLQPREGVEVVVPARDGVLLAIDDILDVRRMRRLLNFKGEVGGEYLPSLFRLISTDQIRLVFFKGVRPVVVNQSIEKLYRIKNFFQQPVKGHFTCLFGNREHPFMQDGVLHYHNGVDIIAPYGTPIHPAREGMVIYTGWRGGFGRTVMVQHQEGYTTLYGHLDSITVNEGDWVTADSVIGHLGSTGWSTGPHLHFTVMKHGIDLDPLFFIW
jgi:murein DD-endopeptidase MepM/ murein hydrolase activator NlpD